MLLARELARLGLRVAIIAFGNRGELPTRVDGVDIVRRPWYRKRGHLVSKVLEPMVIWNALWRTPSRTTVYRAIGLELGLLALYASCSRRRLVFSSANIVDFDPAQILSKRRDRILYRFGVWRADQIVVQSDEQVQLCQAAFGRRPTLIRSLATVSEAPKQVPEAFLWVGRLVSYKRPLDYVALARAVPDARFWMVGVPAVLASERPTADAVRAAAADLPNLELLEPRPRAEIEALMERAVASVNTADFEGMPNVLLEAWSRGVPALVLNHDPDGVVTRYGLGDFAGGSLAALADLAREQWSQRSDRAELARRCRDYIASHHAPGVVARQWRLVIDPCTAAAMPEPVRWTPDVWHSGQDRLRRARRSVADRAYVCCDGAPRTRLARDLVRRRGGARHAAPGDHRRRRWRPADLQRGPNGRGRDERRDLQLPRASRGRLCQGSHDSPPSSDTEVLVHLYEEHGSGSSSSFAGCSRSRSGTSGGGDCCWPVTGSGRSRCSSPAGAPECGSPPR